jgi:hypothetical protein
LFNYERIQIKEHKTTVFIETPKAAACQCFLPPNGINNPTNGRFLIKPKNALTLRHTI